MMFFRRTALTLTVTLAVCAAAAPAAAQTVGGRPLQPIVEVRGPFQHAVIGSSVVTAAPAVLGSAGARLDLPAGAQATRALLFWWGSGQNPDGTAPVVTAPDRQVSLRLPDNSLLNLNASGAGAADPCFTINTAADGTGFPYWQCQQDVTSQLQGLTNLDGDYRLEGLTADIGAPWFTPNNQCGLNNQACSVYVGSFALVILFVNPADTSPRVVQVANGMFFTQFIGDRASDPLLPFEMSNNGGQATIVALEGDAEIPAFGAAAGQCNGTIGDANVVADPAGNFSIPECDFFVLCEGDCIPANQRDLRLDPTKVRATMATAAGGANPPGNVFNETVTSEFAGQVSNVTELNGLDIDTFNLQGRLQNGLFNNLAVGIQTGGDAALVTLVVTSIEDFDADGDGISNINEDELGTDRNNPDTDGDGVPDGFEVFGGNPALPNNTVSNPLDPDSDADGLCDGNNSVAAACADANGDGFCDGAFRVRRRTCAAGEDVNNNGVREPTETSPIDADTDDDGLTDGTEVLTGNYGDPAQPGTVDADGTRPGRQTNPLVADTDGDGLLDGAEDQNGNGVFDPGNNETDPTDADTDDGGEADGSERQNGRDPVDFPDDDNGALDDDDNDGLPNAVEDDIGTDPQNPDTDGDGLLDGVEVNGQNDTDPLDPDTDGDGILDGTEDQNLNGVTEPGELSPVNPDTDGDGLGDGVEDGNQNGVQDVGETDGTDPDTDGDGLCDGDRAVAADGCIAGEDLDLDGSVDATETDPLNPDTDGDGVSDGTEVTSEYPGCDAGCVDADATRPGFQTDPLNPDTDGDGESDGQEDSNVDGNLDGGETDPTDPQNGEIDGGEGEFEPPVPEEEDPLENAIVAGSAAWRACGSVPGSPSALVLLGVALAVLRRRRR